MEWFPRTISKFFTRCSPLRSLYITSNFFRWSSYPNLAGKSIGCLDERRVERTEPQDIAQLQVHIIFVEVDNQSTIKMIHYVKTDFRYARKF